MTLDEFKAEYRVGQRLTSVGIRTSLAQEARKGRIVMVHELATATELEQRRVLHLLRELTPNDAAQVIGSFQVDGDTVVVTKFLMGFTSLLGWLEAAVAESSTTVISTSDNPSTMDMAVHNHHHRRPLAERAVAPALEDTSTQPVLGSPTAGNASPLPGTSSPTPSVPTPEAEATASFTKLFGEPERSAEPPAAPAVRAAEPMSLAPVSHHTPPAGAPTLPEPVKAPTADEPKTGDFTRLFGNEPSSPLPAPASPKPPPVRATPMEQPTATPPPAPFIRRPAADVSPADETGPSPIAPIADSSAPPPPRVRLEALEGVPMHADPASRRDYDSGPRGGPASVPPAPFSAPPLIAVPAGRKPAPTPQSERPDLRPAAPAFVYPTTPSEGGSTEVLTPARPPLNSAPPRTPTPAVGQAPLPHRTSYTPLIVGLGVFVVVMAVIVAYFVMSSP